MIVALVAKDNLVDKEKVLMNSQLCVIFQVVAN